TLAVWRAGALRAATEGQAPWLPSSRAWLVAGALALGMLLLALTLFWPVLGAGLYGDPVGTARLLTTTALALTFAAFAATVALAYQALWRVGSAWVKGVPTTPCREAQVGRSRDLIAARVPGQVSRREALVVGGGAAIFLAAGAYATNRLIAAYLARS